MEIGGEIGSVKTGAQDKPVDDVVLESVTIHG